MTRSITQHPPRLRVKVRGDGRWWWVRTNGGLTRDERLAAELLDVGVEGIVLGALEADVAEWELVDRGRVVRRGRRWSCDRSHRVGAIQATRLGD